MIISDPPAVFVLVSKLFFFSPALSVSSFLTYVFSNCTHSSLFLDSPDLTLVCVHQNMDFVEKVVERFGSGGGQEQVYEERREYYPGDAAPQSAGGPALPPPWVARWSDQDQRWYYVNEATGQRSWERPYGGGGPGPGGPGGYGYQEQVVEERRGYYQEERPKKDHSMMYGAAGVAAGAVGGALLMHEGEKIRTFIHARLVGRGSNNQQ